MAKSKVEKKVVEKKAVVKKADEKLISVQPEMLGIVDKTDLKTVEYDVLVEMGRSVNEVKAYSQWLLGKLGDAVSTRYSKLAEYAKETQQMYNSLKNYVFIYRKFTADDPNFTPDKYYGRIPWGVLALVAVKSDSPVKDVEELMDAGVNSMEGAHRKLKERETGKTIPHKPQVTLYWSEEVKKYKIAINEKDMDLIDWTDVKEQLKAYLAKLE